MDYPIIGRSIRLNNTIEEEIRFSNFNGFSFHQIWYKDGEIAINIEGPKEKILISYNFPFIIHALIDISELNYHSNVLLRKIEYFNHNEVIIHPVCKKTIIPTNDIMKTFLEDIFNISELYYKHGIKVYLENNSKLESIHNNEEDIMKMHTKCEKLNMVLDIAHMDSYENLKRLIDIKYPNILHISDKHFSAIHEHLPIGEGEIDWKYVFDKLLPNYAGKIIFEVNQSDDQIVKSKEIINRILIEEV